MREIKFEYVEQNVEHGGIVREVYTLEDIENNKVDMHYQHTSTWKLLTRRQCTELEDKNGVELYEGDIVKGTEDNEHQGHSNVFIDTWNIQPFSYLNCYDMDLFEVIGNIYENPELLKDSQSEDIKKFSMSTN